MVSVGRHLYTYLPLTHQYMVQPAGKDLSGLLRRSMAHVAQAAGTSTTESSDITGALLSKNPYKTLTTGAQSITFTGQSVVDRRRCYRLHLRTRSACYDLWLAAVGPPLPVQEQPDPHQILKASRQILPSQDASLMEGMNLRLTLHFRNWRFPNGVNPRLFSFTPPPGARRVSSLAGEFSAFTSSSIGTVSHRNTAPAPHCPPVESPRAATAASRVPGVAPDHSPRTVKGRHSGPGK